MRPTLPAEPHPGDNTGEGSRGEGNTVTTEDGHHNAIGRASLATVDVNDTTTTANGSAEHEGAGGNGYANLANVPAPKVDVLVTVPVLSLLGLTDEPAMLDGYGPIPASTARKLVADGASSFYGVLVDPRDGAPLEIGRSHYRLTKAMKKALQLRADDSLWDDFYAMPTVLPAGPSTARGLLRF